MKWIGRVAVLVLAIAMTACTTPEAETTDAPPAQTESAQQPQENTEPAQTEAAQETPAETEAQTAPIAGEATTYTVDFSDIPGIRSLTVGHADDTLYGLALVSDPADEAQKIIIYEIEHTNRVEKITLEVQGPVEKIGAVTGDDDEIYFTTVNRADEGSTGTFTIYKTNLDDGEIHALYSGVSDDYNYGQTLAASDDVVAFTEDMTENEGLYFADVCIVKDDAKQIVNVEVFPEAQVSLLMKDEALSYAASRDDQLFIIDFHYEDMETYEFAVSGDSTSFRLTDKDDDTYLLDNYNFHPEMQGAFVLRVNTANQEIAAYAEEGRNLHSAIFADDDEAEISVVSTLADDVKWIRATSPEALEALGGKTNTGDGQSYIGVFEEDDAVTRYPKSTGPTGDTQYKFQYQIFTK